MGSLKGSLKGSLRGSKRNLWGFRSTRFLSSTLLPFFVLKVVPLLKLNIGKKGTLITRGLLRKLEIESRP